MVATYLGHTAKGNKLNYSWKCGYGQNGATVTDSISGLYNTIITKGTLTVNAVGPVITVQPGNTKALLGHTATFAVTVSGTGPFSYQWKRGLTSVGANLNSYTTPALDNTYNGATYTVTVTGHGSVTSNAATLTISSVPTAKPGHSIWGWSFGW